MQRSPIAMASTSSITVFVRVRPSSAKLSDAIKFEQSKKCIVCKATNKDSKRNHVDNHADGWKFFFDGILCDVSQVLIQHSLGMQ